MLHVLREPAAVGEACCMVSELFADLEVRAKVGECLLELRQFLLQDLLLCV